jgi:uncharacterized protein YdiU (UPF0061 family)
MFNFDNSYIKLLPQFYNKINPTKVNNPQLIQFNLSLAQQLQCTDDHLDKQIIAKVLSGNAIAAGSQPIAMAYAGHQFGTFVPNLGDGRAILLGEVVDKNNIRQDIQLKGSGITPFSRQGDGRAAIGSIIREYIVSEAMYALGIASSRALAIVSTGELVFRDTALPGAVLARVASSHIRIGTFEYFAHRGDHQAIKSLADYVIKRHYPDAALSANPYAAFLEAVINAQAKLVASWMHIGFIHGVMNTDNTSIAGITIDYGPCAFLDAYQENKVFSAIDRRGRYAFNNQSKIALWNLTCLANTLLSLFDSNQNAAIDIAKGLLDTFDDTFNMYWLSGMRAKLGFQKQYTEDSILIIRLLHLMQTNDADYTLTFRALSHAPANNYQKLSVATNLANDHNFIQWLSDWSNRLDLEDVSNAGISKSMLDINPKFIPRNHLIEQVISDAVMDNSYTQMQQWLAVLADPYSEQPQFTNYAQAPLKHEVVNQTFCGT